MRHQVFRADRLRAERECLGLSQHKLCGLIGAGKSQITKYETQVGEPSAFQLVRLAKVLQVSVDYLLGLSDERQGQFRQRELTPDEQRFIEALSSPELGPVLRQLMSAYPVDAFRPKPTLPTEGGSAQQNDDR